MLACKTLWRMYIIEPSGEMWCQQNQVGLYLILDHCLLNSSYVLIRHHPLSEVEVTHAIELPYSHITISLVIYQYFIYIITRLFCAVKQKSANKISLTSTFNIYIILLHTHYLIITLSC